jgi:hypothetical protein
VKAKYVGMDVSQAQEAKQLRDVNTKQRKLVADLSLDKEPLQSVIRYRTRKEFATAMRAKTEYPSTVWCPL